MRSRVLALFGCISLLGVLASAQTPVITTGGVVSAAGLGGSKTITAGSLISIYGSGLASSLALADSPTLSTTLGDVNSVTINGVRAPLQFVAGGQINAQAPWSLIAGPANVVVTRAGVASEPVVAQVTPYSPAVYAFGGTMLAIAVNADGTVTAPAGAIPGVTSHPAAAGDAILFYASGLGPLDRQPPPDGVNSIDALRRTSSQLTVLVGGVSARVDFSGLSPQFAGVYQVNIAAPAGLSASSAVPVQLMIGGATSPDPLNIAMR